MRTLLIVDDEPNIVEGLAAQFEQRYGDSVIVLKAFSGVHALSILQNNWVDVVLSDISMPDLDGIALAEKTEKLWPQIHFVFLSGFDDFDYLHRASSSSVYRGYLLKTEGDEVVLGKIDQELQQCEAETQAENEQHKMLAFLRQAALESTLRGGRSWQEMASELPRLQFSLDGQRAMVMVLGKCALPGKADSAKSLRLISDFIASQAPGLAFEALMPERDTLVWLVQAKEIMDEAEMGSYVYALFESIQQRADAYQAAVSLVVGKAAAAEQIVGQYQRLNSIYEMLAWDGARLVMASEENYSALLLARGQSVRPDAVRFSAFLQQLNSALYSGTPQACQVLFEQEGPKTLRSDQAIALFSVLLDFLREHDLGERFGMPVSDLLDAYLHNGAAASASLHGRLAMLCGEICGMRTENEAHTTQDIINRINRYIDEHIEDYNLSLSELARVMGFNPSYLSRLYRLSTGHKLSEQIDEAKLRHAKALVLSGEMVKNVAERTGFASSSAFILFFKRNTGKTPRQFFEENGLDMQNAETK